MGEMSEMIGVAWLQCGKQALAGKQETTMPIRLTPKDTIGGSFTRRQTLPVVAAPSFWALTG